MSATATLAPARANANAAARPIPLPPPVTNATLPSKLNVLFIVYSFQLYSNRTFTFPEATAVASPDGLSIRPIRVYCVRHIHNPDVAGPIHHICAHIVFSCLPLRARLSLHCLR